MTSDDVLPNVLHHREDRPSTAAFLSMTNMTEALEFDRITARTGTEKNGGDKSSSRKLCEMRMHIQLVALRMSAVTSALHFDLSARRYLALRAMIMIMAATAVFTVR